jgi:hypothetical protein
MPILRIGTPLLLHRMVADRLRTAQYAGTASSCRSSTSSRQLAVRASSRYYRLSRTVASARWTGERFSSGRPDAGACDDDVGCLRR